VVRLFYRDRRYLGARDRRVISETLYGMIRHVRLLEFYAVQARQRAGILAGDPADNVPAELVYAAYISSKARPTSESLVEELLEFWPREMDEGNRRAFVDALNAGRDSVEALENPVKRLSIMYSMPEFIVREWISCYDVLVTEELCTALNGQAATTGRVNTLKTDMEECFRQLHSEGVEVERTLLAPHGLVFRKRLNVSALNSFARGWFELQDEGSQIISLLVDPAPGMTIVDACAGSGGKTLHMAALMKNQGRIHAFDLGDSRMSRMRERLSRAGVTIVLPCPASDIEGSLGRLKDCADAVLIDAPCSGTGTFRRNPGAKIALTEEIVQRFAHVQTAILDRYSTLVKPGGRLVYATCSLLEKENEERVNEFLQAHPRFSIVSPRPLLDRLGISSDPVSEFLKLSPHRGPTDGFFAAVLMKNP